MVGLFNDDAEDDVEDDLGEAVLSTTDDFSLLALSLPFSDGVVGVEEVKRRRLPDNTLSKLIPLPLTPSNAGASPMATAPGASSGEA